MTYREFIRSALPPAPETPSLRRLRLATMATCFLAAFTLVVARTFDTRPPALTVVSLVLGVVGIVATLAFVRRKVRHDLGYWTPERVTLYRTRGDLLPPDRPITPRPLADPSLADRALSENPVP